MLALRGSILYKRSNMPLSYAQLERFYERLVTKARDGGIPCAITSGMACVAFGVAQTTKDCDLLCAPAAASKLLDLLSRTSLMGRLPAYRGDLSAPLDERWFRGGWTSHFVWNAAGIDAYLDVFGVAPRGSSPWQTELEGFYACRHTVAEMKRTNRERDWPYVTALGAQMIEAGDARGWLHIFDEDLLVALTQAARPPASLINQRPVLGLAVKGDLRLRSALHAEVQLWHELDRARIRVYLGAARPYASAVSKARLAPGAALEVQHRTRLQCAQEHLPSNPLEDYGVGRLINDARTALKRLVNPAALAWLPDVRDHFKLTQA
ncbi:MAG: hypothetical protein C5B50_25585 [Verrucomicrobia bacterium]|nr:MAG: hypothetical protein C5B50_25585 [Verrucomicrobiota bacterium]